MYTVLLREVGREVWNLFSRILTTHNCIKKQLLFLYVCWFDRYHTVTRDCSRVILLYRMLIRLTLYCYPWLFWLIVEGDATRHLQRAPYFEIILCRWNWLNRVSFWTGKAAQVSFLHHNIKLRIISNERRHSSLLYYIYNIEYTAPDQNTQHQSRIHSTRSEYRAPDQNTEHQIRIQSTRSEYTAPEQNTRHQRRIHGTRSEYTAPEQNTRHQIIIHSTRSEYTAPDQNTRHQIRIHGTRLISMSLWSIKSFSHTESHSSVLNYLTRISIEDKLVSCLALKDCNIIEDSEQKWLLH